MATGNEQRGKATKRGQVQPNPTPFDQTHVTQPHRDDGQQGLALGEAVVGTGRTSAARRITPILPTLPFRASELATLDDALARASRTVGLHFSVYLGDLGADPRARAEELHESMGDRADDAVLVAVSPGQQVVEVVTGSKAHNRLPDRGCKLAVESMVTAFKEGDLTGGLTSGLQILADQTDS
ncbi:MAG: DUF5130 family protein [Pseudonocardiaceae bacterium]